MAAIGPTAFYTGEVWRRNGLSHPELSRAEGRLLHAVPAPLFTVSRLLGGPTLDAMLLARHRVIDALLEEAIADGRVAQVLELAAGMSPRGWRFTERHPGLVYVDADLPDMAARKREALARIGRPAGHRVAEVDVLAEDGPRSLAAVAGELEAGGPLAVLSEGLLAYLPREGVQRVWAGAAAALRRAGGGVYLADVHVDEDAPELLSRAFAGVLTAFVRSPVRLHFGRADDVRGGLRGAGFADAELIRCSEHPAAAGLDPGAGAVRVVAARGPTRRSGRR